MLTQACCSAALHGVEVGHSCDGQGNGTQDGSTSNQAVDEVPAGGLGAGRGTGKAQKRRHAQGPKPAAEVCTLAKRVQGVSKNAVHGVQPCCSSL